MRSSFPDIDNNYENYLLKSYDETYFPEKIRGAGKYSYVERNREMINNSSFCVIYYDENYLSSKSHSESGTRLARDYAIKKKKEIINVLDY